MNESLLIFMKMEYLQLCSKIDKNMQWMKMDRDVVASYSSKVFPSNLVESNDWNPYSRNYSCEMKFFMVFFNFVSLFHFYFF